MHLGLRSSLGGSFVKAILRKLYSEQMLIRPFLLIAFSFCGAAGHSTLADHRNYVFVLLVK